MKTDSVVCFPKVLELEGFVLFQDLFWSLESF